MIPKLSHVRLHSFTTAALASALALPACHGSVLVHVPAEPPPPPPPPPPPIYWESEPNDDAWFAPWFGDLHPGDSIWIQGQVSDDGSDPQDGLEFTGIGPCRIDLTLFVDDPWADLDVWVYDPWLDEYLAAFTSPWGDEQGTLWIDGWADFQLVVVPAFGTSTWTLEVSAWPEAFAPGASASAPGTEQVILAGHSSSRVASPAPHRQIPASPAR